MSEEEYIEKVNHDPWYINNVPDEILIENPQSPHIAICKDCFHSKSHKINNPIFNPAKKYLLCLIISKVVLHLAKPYAEHFHLSHKPLVLSPVYSPSKIFSLFSPAVSNQLFDLLLEAYHTLAILH